MSFKLGTKHSWEKGIEFSNEEPCPFLREFPKNNEIAEIHSTKLGIKHSRMKGILVCLNEGPHPFQRGDEN